MSHRGPDRSWRSWLAGLCLLCCASTAAFAQLPSGDPVEDLRQALRLEHVGNPSTNQWPRVPVQLILDFRAKNLQKKIDALKTVGELRRALALEEWRNVYPSYEARQKDKDQKDAFGVIDNEKRREVGKRLVTAINQEVNNGSGDAKLAVANMICEMGPAVRSLDSFDDGGFARSLTPQVMTLTVSSDVGVRQEALRALGNINPIQEDAAARFEFILKNDRRLEIRFLAAQGLGQMMTVISQLQEIGTLQRTGTGVRASKADVFRTAKAVVPASRVGLSDVEPRVRAACLKVVQFAAEGLNSQKMIASPFERKDFPPEGWQLTPDEVEKTLSIYEMVRLEVEDVRPYFKLLRSTTPNMIPLLSDPETKVRLADLVSLEMIAQARLAQRKRLESVPLPNNVKGKVDLIVLEDPLAEFLPNGLIPTVKLLRDPDVRIRRAVLDFLQDIDIDAVIAAPAMTPSLADPDRYVRFGAITVLGKLPADDIKIAIPGFGKLLHDDDLKIRQVAAEALKRTGPLARAALADINEALLSGDVEGRVPVLDVIKRLDPADAKVTVPHVILLLTNADARLRKAAAETLGKIGPPARAALPGLRPLIGDLDADVRRAASDAILSISVRPAR